MKNIKTSTKRWCWAAVGLGMWLGGKWAYNEMTRFRLANKTVLITGGSRGLGLILARQLAAKGARIAICARSLDQLANAKRELEDAGAEVLALPADLTDRRQVEEMIHHVLAHYGRLDVVINNAGIIQVGPQDAMRVEDYEEAMKANFWSALYTILAVIPHFKETKGGRIVNITSIGGRIAVPHLLPYTTSKFALVGLSEGMHTELKKHNIHVTTVVPHLMRTGSPRNITVKGNHEAEYAWFKISASSPVAQHAEVAAQKIVRALEYNQSRVTLSEAARIATVIKAVAPGWISLLLLTVNKLLPDNMPGWEESKKGYESESNLSHSLVTDAGERAAIANNQH